MVHKFCLVSFLLIFVFLYLYIQIESFDTNIPVSTLNQQTISTQLSSEISRVLSISVRRIFNLTFYGDISLSQLQVSFTILEPNLTEMSNKEINATDAAQKSNNLFAANNFIVFVNGNRIIISKLNKTPTPSTTSLGVFFNNTSLNDIANYSQNKYTSMPNDTSLTNFYKLDIDNNYNIAPKINIKLSK